MLQRNAIAKAALVCAALAAGGQASAAVYFGDTTGGPTYQRALADFSGLSSVGTDVAYEVFDFSVDTGGLYSFLSVALKDAAGEKWDNYLFLYAGSFDPSAPLAAGVAGNDDYFFGGGFGGVGFSGFSDVALTTGVAYHLVTTGFDNDSFGSYLNIIRGAGEIIPAVPEPDRYAMLLAGLGAIGLATRRRLRRSAEQEE